MPQKQSSSPSLYVSLGSRTSLPSFSRFLYSSRKSEEASCPNVYASDNSDRRNYLQLRAISRFSLTARPKRIRKGGKKAARPAAPR